MLKTSEDEQPRDKYPAAPPSSEEPDRQYPLNLWQWDKARTPNDPIKEGGGIALLCEK